MNLIKDSFSVEVDTTGAGDSFAAGFLYGYINDYSLDKCSKLGNYCAAETIKIIGARPNININDIIKK